MTPPTPTQSRNRWLLLAIAGLFFGSMLLAGALRFSGWQPAASKAHGELLQPPGDLRQVTLRLDDGSAYPWQPARRTWRIVLAPPAGCTTAGVQLAQQLMTVWQLMGRESEHVHVLWIGEPPREVPRGGALHVVRPSAALRNGLPRLHPAAGENPDGVPVYLVDPNGFVVMRYAPGFDPAGLRADLAKLLKLM
jgi:hypothetical protein